MPVLCLLQIGRIPRKILQTFLHSKREPLKRGTEYGITE